MGKGMHIIAVVFLGLFSLMQKWTTVLHVYCRNYSSANMVILWASRSTVRMWYCWVRVDGLDSCFRYDEVFYIHTHKTVRFVSL